MERTLLIVDDEPQVLSLLERVFHKTFAVHSAESAERGLEMLREGLRPSLVISDQRMPGMSGSEFLKLVRTECPHSLRILATAFTDYEALVDAINDAGVHLYVEKPFRIQELQETVEGLIHERSLRTAQQDLLRELEQTVSRLSDSNRRLIAHEDSLQRLVEQRTAALAQANQNLARANAALREAAMRDSLTGLFNRQYLLEFLEHEVGRALRYDRPFSLLFFDLDNFKLVNDSHGHQMGDQVLRKFGELLGTGQARSTDVAARYGGEEFVMVLPETGLEGALVKAERLRSSVAEFDWNRLAKVEIQVTCSVGAATFPDAGKTSDDVLQAADAKLYEAKKNGKNRVAG